MDRTEGNVAWEAPVPLTGDEEVAGFPVGVLPAGVGNLVCEAAGSLDCPQDFVGAAVLALAGSAVGGARVLRVKESWEERPGVYLALVWPAGVCPAAALRVVAGPMVREQARLLGEHGKELERYEVEAAQYEPPLKRPENGIVLPWLEHKYVERPRPTRPCVPRLYVTDATAPGVGQFLAENPRGGVLLREDLSGWLLGLNPARGGRATYLSAWAGQPVCMERPGKAPLMVLEPCLAVLGGLPADRLGLLREERRRADSVLDRMLFAFPGGRPLSKWGTTELGGETMRQWEATWKRLRGLEGKAGATRVVGFTADGTRAWGDLFDRLTEEANANDFPSYLRGCWLQLRRYAARLALVVHYLWWADGSEGEREGSVEAVSVERAGRLVEYFQSHARRVYRATERGGLVGDAELVLNWIERAGVSEFSRRTAHRALWGTLKTAREVGAALEVLCQNGYLRAGTADGGERPGRPAGQVYEVNPLWREGREGSFVNLSMD